MGGFVTLYRYTAVSRDGSRIEGEMEASAQAIVFDQLNELGHFPIDVSEVGGVGGVHAAGVSWFRRKVSSAQITTMTRELAMLLKAGLTLDQCLALLEKDQSVVGLTELVSHIRVRLNDGESFAETLEAQHGVFPPIYCNMVRAAEASGALESVLSQIADAREREQKLHSKILSSALYPSFLVVMAIAMVTLLLTFVVPRFKEMIVNTGAPIPDSARIVVAASDWLATYGGSLLIAILAIVATAPLLWRWVSFRSIFDSYLLRLPVIGYFARLNLTIRFCRTLSTLLASGVELPTALQHCQRVVVARPAAVAIGTAHEALRKGQSFIDPLDQSALFFPTVINMLRVGEETGDLSQSAFYVARMFEEKRDLAVQRLMTVLEPLIIIFVSFFVAGTLVALLSAVISVNDLVI